MIAGLAACGKAYSGSYASSDSTMPASAPSASYSNEAKDYDGGYWADSWEEAEATEEAAAGGAYEEAAEYEEDIIEEPAEPEPEPVEGTEIDPDESEQKLIYTCDVQMETMAYQETMDNIKSLIKKYNGIIESESTSDGEYDWYYSNPSHSGTKSTYMTVRIPAKDYDHFLANLEGSDSKIRSQSQYVQNITRAYNDQTVLIEALKTQETRLIEMMDKAETIEDMITVEARLTEVQTQLNQAKRALATMDTNVSYSTINLSINEVREYTPNTHRETFGERLARGLRESWSGFGEFLQDALIAIIYLFPFLILIGAIAFVIILLVRRGNKKRAERMKAAGFEPAPKVKKERKRFVRKNKGGEAAPPQSPDDNNQSGLQ